MARQVAILLLALIVSLAGCSDEVTTGPTASDIEAERARVKAQISQNKGRTKTVKAVASTKKQGSSPGAGAGFGAVDEDYAYQSEGRRDPFQPYRIESSSDGELGGGPLEQFELEQLAVVALVWDGDTARAMVSGPSGTTYTIGVGTPMGKNAGRVIHIGDNLVLVKETYVDYAGEQSTKDVELRIHSGEGG